MILICGLPNAGKTTFSAQYGNVIHFDEVPHRTAAEQYRTCNLLAADAEGDVCVEGVYNTRRRRMELLDAIADKPGPKVCIWLDTPEEECVAREHSYRRRPDHIVRVHARNFQPPTLEEGWDTIIVIREILYRTE